MANYILRLKGGPGSGHYGHKGIPGHRGGSLPREESNFASHPLHEDIPAKVSHPLHGDKLIIPKSEFPVKNPAGTPGNPYGLLGLDLYKMPNVDTPQYGVHGGTAYLTNKGKKICQFIANNADSLSDSFLRKDGNFKYAVRSAKEFVSPDDYNDSLGTMSSSEAASKFGDIAKLYRAMWREFSGT